jgi:hypothetical protein
MNDETPKIKERLEEVFNSIPCAVVGCWPLHGCRLEHYFDSNSESYVLEVWPMGIKEPEDHHGNGHHRTNQGLLYELAEFDFLHIIEEIPAEHFHFSQARSLFEIGWQENENNLELRIHILPIEVADDV